MDRLRRDLRKLFDRKQAGLGNVSQSSRHVLQAGMARREGAPGNRVQVAAGIAAAVIAVLVISTFVYVRSAGFLGTAPGAASGSRTTPSPLGSKVTPYMVDADALDASTGWELLSNCSSNGAAECQYFVSATADGGRTWSKPIEVGPSYSRTSGDAPRIVRVLDRQDGFVYGHSVAFATHDGGLTWTALSLQAQEYVAITARNGVVWAVTYPCPKGSGLTGSCVYQARSSHDAGRTWSTLLALPTDFYAPAAAEFGVGGLVISGGPASRGSLVTPDGGGHWTRAKPACAPSSFGETVATSDGVELFDLCLDKVGMTVTLRFSPDAGVTWKTANTPGMPGLIVSPSRGTAVLTSNDSTISITHDRGETWRQVGPAGLGFATIRFATASAGWAVDIYGHIWVTEDGGDTWKSATGAAIPIAPKPSSASSAG